MVWQNRIFLVLYSTHFIKCNDLIESTHRLRVEVIGLVNHEITSQRPLSFWEEHCTVSYYVGSCVFMVIVIILKWVGIIGTHFVGNCQSISHGRHGKPKLSLALVKIYIHCICIQQYHSSPESSPYGTWSIANKNSHHELLMYKPYWSKD